MIAEQPAEVRQLYFGLMAVGAPRAAAGLVLDVLIEESQGGDLDEEQRSPALRGLLVRMLPFQIIDDLVDQVRGGAVPRPETLVPFLRQEDPTGGRGLDRSEHRR